MGRMGIAALIVLTAAQKAIGQGKGIDRLNDSSRTATMQRT